VYLDVDVFLPRSKDGVFSGHPMGIQRFWGWPNHYENGLMAINK
jgi:hypothetical protein